MLKAILASLEGLSDEIKALYAPIDGGKFKLNVEAVDGFSLDNTEELKTKLTATQTENATLKTSAEAFKDLDPAAARSAIARLADLDKLDPNKEADKILQTRLDQQRTDLQSGFNKELEPLKALNDSLVDQISTLTVDSMASAALNEHKGNAALLMPHIKSAIKTEIKDGAVSVSVVKPDGSAMLNNAGNPVTVSEFVAGMKANVEFEAAFGGSGHSGSGRSTEQNGKGGGGASGNIGGDRVQREQAIKTMFPELKS